MVEYEIEFEARIPKKGQRSRELMGKIREKIDGEAIEFSKVPAIQIFKKDRDKWSYAIGRLDGEEFERVGGSISSGVEPWEQSARLWNKLKLKMEEVGVTNPEKTLKEIAGGLKPEHFEIKGKGKGTEERKSALDKLINIGFAQAERFIQDTVTDDPFAVIDAGGHLETHPVLGETFTQYLMRAFYHEEGKGVSEDTVKSAAKTLAAEARFGETDRRELYIRVGKHGEDIWYDLCGGRWKAVRITKGSWSIEKNPPQIFQRWGHMKEQIKPSEEGDFNALKPLVNVKEGENRRDDWLLLKGYLGSCLIPDIPHPIPIAMGPQGSAKTFLFRIIRRLIDPSSVEVMGMPKSRDDAIVTLNANYLLLLDNISELPEWLADILCRASTGEGYMKRELYTDRDQVPFSYHRCVGVNTISGMPTEPDVLDRAYVLELGHIPRVKREFESVLWERFERAKPKVLGALFDMVAGAMKIIDDVREEFHEKKRLLVPRMADFALWGEAIARAGGHEDWAFLRAYNRKIGQRETFVFEENPIGLAAQALVESVDKGEITLRPKKMKKKLEEMAEEEDIDTDHDRWPGNAAWTTKRLKQVEADLKSVGVDVEFPVRDGYPYIRLCKNSEATLSTPPYPHFSDGKQAPGPSTPHLSEGNVGRQGKFANLGKSEKKLSRTQLDKLQRVMEIIDELEEESEKGASIKAVKKEAKADGIDPDFVDEMMKRERESGRLYSPEEGVIKHDY